MSQRQQYAVVPIDASDEMTEAAWESNAADYVGENKFIHNAGQAWEVMIKAAPPPPDQVLSYEEKIALVQQVRLESGGRVGIEEIEIIERAVLKQLGAKNV